MSKPVFARSADVQIEPPPLPSRFCNREEIRSAIQSLEKPFFCFSNKHPWDTYSRIVSSSWQIVLLWFLNLKWGIKIDFLKTRNRCKRYQLEKCRIDAEVLVAIFNLCEFLHSIEHPTAMTYKSALRFWFPIAAEFKGSLNFKEIRNNNANEVKLILQKLKGLRRKKEESFLPPSNPYCASKKPITYEFIEACLDVLDNKKYPIIDSDSHHKFKNDLWFGRSKKLQTKGYIKALEAQCSWLAGTPKEGWRGSLFVDGDRLLTSTGRGSQYLKIPPFPKTLA